LRPQDSESGKIRIYRIREVTGRAQDGTIRPFIPYARNADRGKGMGLYSISVKKSPLSSLFQHYLTIHYVPDSEPQRETLSVSLECSNQGLTEQLHTGEIQSATDTSPAMATFSNILPPTREVEQLNSERHSWSILSHLHVNLAPLLTADTLREILLQYALPEDPDISRKLGNGKRLEAIVGIRVHSEDYFLRGRPVHGHRLDLTLDQSGFASRGDMFLFGDVLDSFFGLFHHINTFSRLNIIEKNSHEVISWIPRLGTKRLI
jgi:type VI secretion system protein ImpG